MADRRLQIFHAVAREGSFTRAAEALFMSQPAVTFQIRQLEERYQVRLFERGHGRITLTPAGEMVMRYAEQIIALSDEMETRLGEMTGEMRGLLLIGASSTLGESILPQVLGEFNALYPQARPRLVIANSENIESRVAAHSIDVGLIETSAKQPNIETIACGEDELQVICTPDYPLAGLNAVTPKQLRDYEYIAREPGSGTREATEACFAAAGVAHDSLKTLMELGSPEALKGVVATGLGFAIVSRIACDADIQSGRLVAIPLKPRLKRPLAIITPKDRFRSRLVSTFVDFARQQVKELCQ